jgi:hypothetical protein
LESTCSPLPFAAVALTASTCARVFVPAMMMKMISQGIHYFSHSHILTHLLLLCAASFSAHVDCNFFCAHHKQTTARGVLSYGADFFMNLITEGNEVIYHAARMWVSVCLVSRVLLGVDFGG